MSTLPPCMFLGITRPALLSARDLLLQHSSRSGELDLSHLFIVLPGGRAARNLRALLLESAAAAGLPFSPPRTITPGEIPAIILDLFAAAPGRPDPLPLAAAPAQRLCWAQALLSLSSQQLLPLVPRPPARSDTPAWLALGDLLAVAHRDLAAGLLTFADVPERCRSAAPFLETDRFAAAAIVQQAYQQILHSQGLRDPNLARLAALAAQPPPLDLPSQARLILLGVPELSRAARAALCLVAERLSILVFADPDLAGRFDSFGCPLPDVWENLALSIREDQLVFTDAPSDQAAQALVSIARLEDRFSADQVAIGVADEDLVPFLRRRAADAGLHVRYAAGVPLSRSGSFKLLSALAGFLDRRDFTALRALVRHPDIESRLRSVCAAAPLGDNWLPQLDDYAAQTLHGPLTGAWLTQSEPLLATLTAINNALNQLLAPLLAPDAPLPLRQWVAPIQSVLANIYQVPAPDSISPETLSACRAIQDALLELANLPAQADSTSPALSASQVLRFLVQHCADQSIPDQLLPDSVEMLGWLELQLDPSDALIIVGMNQDKVPAAFRGDPFLSDRLRETLGLPCTAQRFARDAFILDSLLRSRASLTLIAGRRALAGDSLWPSRLLTACPPPLLAPRLRRFLGKSPEPLPPARLRSSLLPASSSAYRACPVTALPSVTSFPVTSFRTYLRSPYVYYLKHVLKLQELAEPAGEMEPMSFGSFIHSVVEAFGRSDLKHSTDPARIDSLLQDEVSRLARAYFGPSPHVALQLQMHIARRRLADFARWQAGRARDGWLIFQPPEWTPSSGSGALDVDGRPAPLTGRIDRIEKHHQSDQLCILDFKTSDSPSPPDKTHRDASGWFDLQLPLYRHLARELGADDFTTLGYVVISSDSDGVRILPAQWSPDDLALADEAARNVIRSVRRNLFSDPGEGAQPGTIFSALCGLEFLDPAADSDDPQSGLAP